MFRLETASSQSGRVPSNSNRPMANTRTNANLPMPERRQPENKVDEFTVNRGETSNGFRLALNGALTYEGKTFTPRITVNKSIANFTISFLNKKWAGGIANDQYGQHLSYFLDTTKMTATPMQKPGSWNAAVKILWSPSQRYMVALCAYEGDSFVRIDTKTKNVRDVGISYTEPASNYETMLRIIDEPRWSRNSDVLLFNVAKYCNPYEGSCGEGNRNVNRVLARFGVTLDVATLRISYAR